MLKLKSEQDDFLYPPPECDPLCPYRPCYHPGYDKGTYSPGRGYTSYHKKPIYVCMTRMMHGCGEMRSVKTVDTNQLIQDLNNKKSSIKATIKATRFMSEMIQIISMLLEGIDRNETGK